MFRNYKEKLIKELEKIIKERYDGKILVDELLKPNKRRDLIITKLKRRKIWFTREEESYLGILEVGVRTDEIFRGVFLLPFAIVKWLKNFVTKNNKI